MLLIYSVIIIIAFTFFGMTVIKNYQGIVVRNEEIRLFQIANIVADTYRTNKEDVILINTMVNSYGKQANARILILDSNKKVIVDNFNTYIDEIIDNEEIRSALGGTAKSGTYILEGRNILQLSVPITNYNENKREIGGAVLISASLEEEFSDIKNLRNMFIKLSALSISVALLLTIIAANSLTKPLRRLNDAVERLSSGELGYKVQKRGSGEIRKLIDSFNEMSGKLRKIENNRKRFINNISHELKTPLTSIRALIDSLTIGESDIGTYKEYLEDIKEEAVRMEQLVNYLLNSIKLEDINLDLKVEDLKDTLEDTIKLVKPYAEKHGVTIIANKIESLNIKFDKNKIKEVMLNLFDNAVKYRDPDKKRNYINVGIERNSKEARLIIEDNGLGIRNDDLSDIFNRGFRVLDSGISTDTYNESHGLGLSIVKNIIEKHGWEISVESTYGMGSRFIIKIPIRHI